VKVKWTGYDSGIDVLTVNEESTGQNHATVYSFIIHTNVDRYFPPYVLPCESSIQNSTIFRYSFYLKINVLLT